MTLSNTLFEKVLTSDLQHYSSLEIGTRLQLPLYLDPVLKYILVTKSNKNMVK